MDMKSRNSETAEAMNSGKGQNITSQNKTRILIVSNNSTIRQELAKLINHENDLEICNDPQGDCQTQDAIEKHRVDLAIIDITSRDTNCFRVTDTTRLQYSNVPVILLSMHNEAMYKEHALPAEPEESLFNQQAIEQIIKAIRYVQSLLRSKIFGFTLAVKIERNPRNDY
jgi:DNA-binding NarL/FixJ family response regulator